MRKTYLQIFLLIICCGLHILTNGQQIMLTDSDGKLHQLTINNGNCTVTAFTSACAQQADAFSIALYRDKAYFNTPAGQLYTIDLKNPAACVNTGITAAGNALTVDRNGTLYWVNGNILYRLPVGRTAGEVVGTMPFQSSGDLIFFGDKLYMAASGNRLSNFEFCIVEVDITDPANSKIKMITPGYDFYGLVNVTNGCNSNKVYGIASSNRGSDLVELDLEQGNILGTTCNLGINVYDAASITETGEVRGANITSIDVKPQCDYTTKGTLTITATSATAGVTFNYSLNNNAQSNTTGIFQNLLAGNYQVQVSTSDGCVKDSFTTIQYVERIQVNVQQIEDTCGQQKGAAIFSGLSNHNGLQYSLNNAAFVAVNRFNALASGPQTLRVRDVNECYLDTSFIIRNIQPPIPPVTIDIQESSCSGNDGTLKVNVTPAMGITAITLNGVNGQVLGSFSNLAAGTYSLRLVTATCSYDSLVQVPRESAPQPVVNYTAIAPNCHDRMNGSLTVSITGNSSPYSIGLNNGALGTVTRFPQLATGPHELRIRDANGCIFTDTLVVPAFQAGTFSVARQTTPIDCWQPNNGKATLTITGSESPYFYQINGKTYQSGQEASGLAVGNYQALISNGNNCILGSADLTITEQNMPGVVCDTVYVPTGFTPNGDGRNDYLLPVTSSATKQFIFRVFNRVGQVLFESGLSGKGWDGRFKGLIQPPGVYVWMVTYTNQAGRTRYFKGTTVLIR